MTASHQITRLPHEVYRFTLQALGPMRVPRFKGSALRGLLGHSLKRVVCALRHERCPACLVRDSCTYQRVFETRVDPAQGPKRGVDTAPHPYVLEPPEDERTELAQGDEISCTLVLVGPARGILPYLVYTFQEMGRRGITVERKPMALVRVDALGVEGWQTVFDPADGRLRAGAVEAPPPTVVPLDGRLTLELVTPLRLKSQGRLVTHLDPRTLVVALGRRWMDLRRYYGDSPDRGAFQGLLAAAEGLKVRQAQVSWLDWPRYSNRQQTRMQLGGLRGLVELEGDLAPLAPWFAWAERFHVGKATAFGLGKVRVRA